jgi:hypothetical protein
MTKNRLLSSACATVLLLTTACGKDEAECGEPLYGGNATDEAWMTMVDAQKKAVSAERAVSLSAPTPGETYAADAPPPRWTWSSPLRASLERPMSDRRLALAHPRVKRSALAWLGELILPTAEAHLPPYTGDIYWVRVTVPGRACPVEVLTSELEWQLDAATWSTLGEARNQDLSIEVTSAYLVNNQLTEGPYRPESPRVFRRAGGGQ